MTRTAQQLEQVGTGYQSDEEEDMEEDEDEAEPESPASDDEEMEDDDDEADAQVDPEFRRRVAEALQVAGMGDGITGAEEEDADEDDEEEDESEDEDAMDDEQMLALDEKLASIFKERTAAKKTNGASEYDGVLSLAA